MKERYVLAEPEPGKKLVLQVMPGDIVREVRVDAVIDSLLRYIENYLPEYKTYALTHRQATECVKYWMSRTTSIQMPLAVGEKNSEGLFFHRLSFNFTDEPKETPIIDDFFSRCTNANALKKFLGGLFVQGSSRHQYVWVHGGGGDGKGSLANGLSRELGLSCILRTVPGSEGQKQFFTHSLLGKRLCIFPECNKFSFPNDELFKQWTGDKTAWFEEKGKMGFKGELEVKFMFLSNQRPKVTGGRANMRRLIYSEVSEAKENKFSPHVYDSLIASELPSFLIKCRALYAECCPMNEDIVSVDKDGKFDETTAHLIEDNEEKYSVITDKYIKKDAGGFVASSRLREFQALQRMDEIDYRNWLDYLRLNLDIKPTKHKVGDTKLRGWSGISELTAVESVLQTLNSITVREDDTVAGT